jgi:hypothetical protein
MGRINKSGKCSLEEVAIPTSSPHKNELKENQATKTGLVEKGKQKKKNINEDDEDNDLECLYRVIQVLPSERKHPVLTDLKFSNNSGMIVYRCRTFCKSSFIYHLQFNN